MQSIKNQTNKHFLVFPLGITEKAAIAIEEIIEVFQLSFREVVPVEEVPTCVLGNYEWRQEKLWLVDLENLFGLTPMEYTTTKFMTIVIKNHNKFVGICVRKLLDLKQLNPRDIQSPNPNLFRSDLLPFLQGYFLEQNQDALTILNPQTITQLPSFKIEQLSKV